MDDRRELSRLFSELRRSDEGSAPPFRQVLERARAGRTASSRRPALRFAAAVAVVIVTAMAAVRLLRPAREEAGREEPVTVARWKSPTDWLLRTPGVDLLGELPGTRFFPGDAGLDGAGRAGVESPGDRLPLDRVPRHTPSR